MNEIVLSFVQKIKLNAQIHLKCWLTSLLRAEHKFNCAIMGLSKTGKMSLKMLVFLSNAKVLLTVYFVCNDILHQEFLLQDRTVNTEHCLEIKHRLPNTDWSNYTETHKYVENWGLCITITHMLTYRYLYVSFWPKT